MIGEAAIARRDLRSFAVAPPGLIYQPALSARASRVLRSGLRQASAACLSAVATASFVVVAVNREAGQPNDFHRHAASVYRQADPSLDFVDRWGETEFAGAPPDDFITTNLTKTVRTIRFARPAVLEVAAHVRPRFPVAYSLAAVDAGPVDIDKPATTSKPDVAGLDEVSRYLWEVYQRTPTKKDGTGDFTWKDPAAAKRAGMPLPKYVIGGMDPDFREQLYHAGRAMDAAGINWSILSAFRDDYRQRIASGLKAGARNSLHGGSARTGGYGHGRAVDITSTDGEAHEVWRWLDANGAKYGLYRPMPGYDPAHVQSRGDWRKLAASLRQSRIKEAKANRPAVAHATKASVVANATE